RAACVVATSLPLTELSTLSLHDALPILTMSNDAGGYPTAGPPTPGYPPPGYPPPGYQGDPAPAYQGYPPPGYPPPPGYGGPPPGDRKSTRLNSSHGSISYAVFCLKKKSS